MGMLIDGKWTTEDEAKTAKDGSFQRKDAAFRNWITPDGAPGPTGAGGFKAEPGRYHLYVSYACPWAHRTLIFRALKGLEDMVGVSVTHWLMQENGWTFEPGPGVIADDVNGAAYAHHIYAKSKPDYTGRASVPILWDKVTGQIVSNESADIIRMFNSAFDGVGASAGDYYPVALRPEIDAINDRVYATLNNGVYRSGFSKSQAAYEAAVEPLFDTLDWLEGILSERRYLLGDQTTEADWRLFPTLFRFDAVYHGHFKCSKRRLIDYPNLWAYARDLYQTPGVAETSNMEHARRHYYESHLHVNPTGIVPAAPTAVDFSAPHGRDRLAAA